MSDVDKKVDLLAPVTDIVSAYLQNNQLDEERVPELIKRVRGALDEAFNQPVVVPVEKPKPAVSIRNSVTPDHIICLFDGKKFKSLKRHLRSAFKMSPEEYREFWDLPRDYPMVAPNYAAARADVARRLGLGQMRRRNSAGAAPVADEFGTADDAVAQDAPADAGADSAVADSAVAAE